jgi:ABC-type multidrug transport system ATPase subunit
VINEINIRNLNLSISNNEIIKNLSLSIRNNGINCLLGPNGSGKSMLVKTIALLFQPQSGEILWNAANIPLLSTNKKEIIQYRRQVSYMWQEPIFLNDSTYKNLELPLIYRGVEREIRISKIKTLAKEIGITKLLDSIPRNLSTGQKQKISFLRSILSEPKILILDEPTSSLDPTNIKWFENYIKAYQQKSKSLIIWVTHDIFQAQRISQQVFIMNDGSIIGQGKISELLTDSSNDMIYRYLHGDLL